MNGVIAAAAATSEKVWMDRRTDGWMDAFFLRPFNEKMTGLPRGGREGRMSQRNARRMMVDRIRRAVSPLLVAVNIATADK